MLEEGAAFPDFSLSDQDGRVLTLHDLAGIPAIIYFYPKDDTPGCTVEACEFQAHFSKSRGIRIVGVSPDSPKKHIKFREKFGLGFTLLSDPERELIQACGLWVEKTLYGRKYMGVARTTVWIGADGVVRRIWRNVKPDGHASAVAEAVK